MTVIIYLECAPDLDAVTHCISFIIIHYLKKHESAKQLIASELLSHIYLISIRTIWHQVTSLINVL